MIYSWIDSIVGAPSTGANSTYVTLACVVIVVTFVLCLDVVINSLFKLSRLKERRK